MTKIWYSSKELALIDGLPSTMQGVNRKARVEGWKSRKRSGIQGKAIEYHIDTLPDFVKYYLTHVQEPSIPYTVSTMEPIQVWVAIFLQLKPEEQEDIMIWLMRNGIKGLVSFIKQEN